MKKMLALALAILMLLSSVAALAEAAPQMPPAPPSAEADSYTGFVRDYANKNLWFDSTVYHGFYTAYQIVKGNGDDTFDVDTFINSAMGEKILSTIIYELCLVGDSNYASDYMVNYWQGRGLIEKAYDTEEVATSWLTFTPDYMLEEGNADEYPVVFCFHGNGGTLFEAINHGFVNICYDNEFMVVVPDNNNMQADLVTGNITAYLDRMEAEGYPIDRTKVYVTGMSKGNMSSMYAGIVCSDIIAGVAGHSGSGFFFSIDQYSEDAVVSPLRVTAEQIAAANTMPLYIQTGACDMHQLPYTDAALVGINAWLDMLGVTNDALRTEDNMLGITADKVYTQYIDGTRHTLCEYFDADGINMMTLVGIDNHPHWVTPSYAQNAWDFLKTFSRVDGALVVDAAK